MIIYTIEIFLENSQYYCFIYARYIILDMAQSIQLPFEDQLLTGLADVVTNVCKTSFVQYFHSIFQEIKEDVIYELNHPEEEKIWT